jgi:PncC family amidohydrolase
MADTPANDPAVLLIQTLAAASQTLAAAESCTAGLVADRLVRVPGASRVFWGSFVAYTEDAKARLLGIDPDLIRRHGAVSRETALAMASGALEKSGAHLAVSVTGLAGPDGDGSGQPVGTVWIGIARRGLPPEAVACRFAGDRNVVRGAAAQEAIGELLKRVSQNQPGFGALSAGRN